MISIHDELHFEPARLWLDARRSRAASFVSHAHTDHIGSHALTICTSATAQLMQLRLGRKPVAAATFAVREYGEPFEHEGIPMRLVPAGHVLGSAQLQAETPEGTFLYTGDFKIRAGRTHAACVVPRCDVLVMECTFGRPHYRFPFRAEVEAELVRICTDALAAARTPVVYAYALGKAQEVISTLNAAGIPIMAHGAVADICDVYRAVGVDLGAFKRFEPAAVAGHVLVAPPETRRMKFVERLPNRVDIAVTGWARDASAKFRLGVDVALPYSDHADFPELLDFVARANPKKVYCLHGFPEFVHHLRRAGVNAEWLAANVQMELFR